MNGTIGSNSNVAGPTCSNADSDSNGASNGASTDTDLPRTGQPDQNLTDQTSQPPQQPHAYDPQTKTSVRSSCPGLNALANHHYLPHSGRNITRELALSAMYDGLNVGSDMAGLLWAGAHHWHLTHTSPSGVEVFDLDEVSRHGGIEHDGSLTREDAARGDAVNVDQGMVKGFMAHFGDGDVTAERAAGVLEERIKGNKREWGVESDGDTVKSNIFSWGNLAMLIGTMGDVEAGRADAAVVEAFLGEERLPVELGWKRTATTINLVNLNILIGKMQLHLGAEMLEDYAARLKSFLLRKPHVSDD